MAQGIAEIFGDMLAQVRERCMWRAQIRDLNSAATGANGRSDAAITVFKCKALIRRDPEFCGPFEVRRRIWFVRSDLIPALHEGKERKQTCTIQIFNRVIVMGGCDNTHLSAHALKPC